MAHNFEADYQNHVEKTKVAAVRQTLESKGFTYKGKQSNDDYAMHVFMKGSVMIVLEEAFAYGLGGRVNQIYFYYRITDWRNARPILSDLDIFAGMFDSIDTTPVYIGHTLHPMNLGKGLDFGKILDLVVSLADKDYAFDKHWIGVWNTLEKTHVPIQEFIKKYR